MAPETTISTFDEPALPVERIGVAFGDPDTGERRELQIEAFAYSALLAIHRDIRPTHHHWVITHRVSGLVMASGFARAADAARCAATIHASGARLWLSGEEMSSDDRRRIRGAVQEHA